MDEEMLSNADSKGFVDVTSSAIKSLSSSGVEDANAAQLELVFSINSEGTLQYHHNNETQRTAEETKGEVALPERDPKTKQKRRYSRKTVKAGRKPSGGSGTNEKRLMCHICSKLCSQHMELKDHIRTHTGERPYHCDKCPKMFVSKSNLRSHLKTHSGDKAYRCDQCSASFLFPNSLWAHQRSAHSDARPYTCAECSATFKLPTHLKRHMYLHTGEKPFKCDLCPATFIQKGNMKIHMKVHNKASQQRMVPVDSNHTHSHQAPPPALPAPPPASQNGRLAPSGPAPSTDSSSNLYPCPLPQQLSCGVSGGTSDSRKGLPQGTGLDSSLSSQVPATASGSDHSSFMGGGGGPPGGVVMGYFPHLWTMVPSQHSPRH